MIRSLSVSSGSLSGKNGPSVCAGVRTSSSAKRPRVVNSAEPKARPPRKVRRPGRKGSAVIGEDSSGLAGNRGPALREGDIPGRPGGDAAEDAPRRPHYDHVPPARLPPAPAVYFFESPNGLRPGSAFTTAPAPGRPELVADHPGVVARRPHNRGGG